MIRRPPRPTRPAPLFPYTTLFRSSGIGGVFASKAQAMNSDSPPDRLAIDPESPHFDQTVLERGIGIRFKGAERTDVEEYSMSEGWVRVALGKKVDRRGRSEERRVGKECGRTFRCRWSTCHIKKKK